MEALAISAANLDTIEKNLGAVAKELGGVIENVSDVNTHVNDVEEKVADLNDEVKRLVIEIKENTVITNARQSIMYNNEQIEKKYGYYDAVRRTSSSLIDAILNSNISIKALRELKEDILLHNPNYWLANAIAAITCWLLDDKSSCEKEVHNALSKNSEKTSLFFSAINLKLGRNEAAKNWLIKYLSLENPTELDKDFVTVIDLVATGEYDDECKEICFNKINKWLKILNTDPSLREKQINKWQEELKKHTIESPSIYGLSQYIEEFDNLNENLSKSYIFKNILNEFEKITYNEKSNKKIDEILENLIYEYEENEKIFEQDNLKNKLIIKYNGNREQAIKEYEKQTSIYDIKTDLLSLLSNMVIYKEEYKISNDAQKIALSLISEYIKEAINNLKNSFAPLSYTIKINNFKTTTTDGKNHEAIEKDLHTYIENTYNYDDKGLIIALIIINILGIIGIFITSNSRILSTIIIVILLIGNIILFAKLNSRTKIRNNAKQAEKNTINSKLEYTKALLVDATTLYKDNLTSYDTLINYLDNLKSKNYTNSNNERNIIVGDSNGKAD